MDVAASEFKVEGQDCYDLGTWYPDAEQLGVEDEKESETTHHCLAHGVS